MRPFFLILLTGAAALAQPSPQPPDGMVYVPAGTFIMGSRVGRCG
jgi:hypothetical protein